MAARGEALERLRASGLDARVEDGRLHIRAGRGFSLADLPAELLEDLMGFEEILVEAPEGYYFYFRRGDVEKLLELKRREDGGRGP
ncbi:hypothetical protein CF15_04935 [Pyrodictium occultum]|uniref:Uncharacterized protein n=1 Tax=Pyrodictium occultum TaxID=2309 RepID=A0A0V8RVP3_PYROC|nr:hypothetical protein [Pyrodictium occultum]KSW12116.1 hypothetical protein CF15_04935 [Pyrodictium occultum]